MAELPRRFQIGPLPEKYNRPYLARDRNGVDTYELRLSTLACSCADFRDNRAGFPETDPRRVCAHLYDKLYSTKVEREFDPVVQLFIRYGRNMLTLRVVDEPDCVLVIGQPFDARTIRAIGAIGGSLGSQLLATYNARSAEWADGDTRLNPETASRVLAEMRKAFPDAFSNSAA